MENSWHQLQPKTSFLVRLADRLTDQSWQTLTQLYQPIIGPSAAGLYSALFWLPKTGQYHRHATLLAILRMDLAHLYDARLRLEATGLLTTTVSTKDDLTSFNYDLHAPLLPAAFFKDDLLSVQLLGVVGEDLYQSLVSVNTSTTERSEVFHVDGQELAELPTAITAGRQRLDAETQATAPALQVTPADFDFKLLGEILEHSFIDTRALRSERQLLLTEHATYGLDEVTMARYIGEATDLATNQFNAETFKRVIAQNFGRPQSAKSVAQPQKTATTPANQSVNSAEQALIKVATNTAPAVFLQAIKQKSGGFVTDGEQRIVRDLVSRQLFPEAVLNLMVYHVLVYPKNPGASAGS
ncbi:replication initiation/membrane attachment protein [Levilactobacillus brevis]|nr:replication initiation/membrane attachment protein [Levilactobacillus brevis]